MADIEEQTENVADDLAPNDGGLFLEQPAPEQVEAENKDRAMIIGAQPLLDEIFAWIDAERDSCDSVDNIDLKSETKATVQIQAQKLLREKLMVLRVSLQNMCQEHGVDYRGKVEV